MIFFRIPPSAHARGVANSAPRLDNYGEGAGPGYEGWGKPPMDDGSTGGYGPGAPPPHETTDL